MGSFTQTVRPPTSFRRASVPTSTLKGRCVHRTGCVRRWREALGLRDRMVAEGIKLDGYSFSALIEACSKGGQVNCRCTQTDRRPTDDPVQAPRSSCWRGGCTQSPCSLRRPFFENPPANGAQDCCAPCRYFVILPQAQLSRLVHIYLVVVGNEQSWFISLATAVTCEGYVATLGVGRSITGGGTPRRLLALPPLAVRKLDLGPWVNLSVSLYLPLSFALPSLRLCLLIRWARAWSYSERWSMLAFQEVASHTTLR